MGRCWVGPSFWELFETKILNKWSQVTPLFELNEMGQYFPQFRFFTHFLISHFPLHLCGSFCQCLFAFLMLIFFNLFHTISSSFLTSSINKSCSCCFFVNKNKNSVLLFLSAFSGTFLSWIFALLLLFLAWGGWRFCSCSCCALGFGEN